MASERVEAPEVVTLQDLRGVLARLHFHPQTPREHLANVRELGYLETMVRDLLRSEVAASRTPHPTERKRSWADIAIVLGVWPSSAHERFGYIRPRARPIPDGPSLLDALGPEWDGYAS